MVSSNGAEGVAVGDSGGEECSIITGVSESFWIGYGFGGSGRSGGSERESPFPGGEVSGKNGAMSGRGGGGRWGGSVLCIFGAELQGDWLASESFLGDVGRGDVLLGVVFANSSVGGSVFRKYGRVWNGIGAEDGGDPEIISVSDEFASLSPREAFEILNFLRGDSGNFGKLLRVVTLSETSGGIAVGLLGSIPERGGIATPEVVVVELGMCFGLWLCDRLRAFVKFRTQFLLYILSVPSCVLACACCNTCCCRSSRSCKSFSPAIRRNSNKSYSETFSVRTGRWSESFSSRGDGWFFGDIPASLGSDSGAVLAVNFEVLTVANLGRASSSPPLGVVVFRNSSKSYSEVFSVRTGAARFSEASISSENPEPSATVRRVILLVNALMLPGEVDLIVSFSSVMIFTFPARAVDVIVSPSSVKDFAENFRANSNPGFRSW